MEGMLVVQPKMMDHLKPFINYSALYLKNMIENSSELKAAYDNLKRVNTKLVKEVETRKKAEENLKKNALLLKTAGRTTRFGGWSADPDGGNLVWSREVADIHEMGPDYSPTLDEAIQFYAPEWREKIAGVFKSCAIEGTPFDEEMEILTGSGRRFWVRATGEAMRDSSGTIIQVHGSFQDITGRKRAEEERNRLQAQLAQAQKMESIGRLAGGVAHDFNNMLSIILGNVEMILDDQYLEKPALPNLLQIKKAAERSANLTRQLLAFARKQTIAPQVIDLNEAVEGMLKMLRRLIGENIDLAWLPGIALWPVNIDPSQIDQILANLCVNARDAIQDIGKITIETRNISFDTDYCREHEDFLPGDYVMTAISDNGCGMDKKVLGNLFEPFFTTKGVGKGTGLGLATVYGIVKQNNGFINVYSEPENGTTFKIYLPRHAETKIVKQNSKIKQADPTGCETILLVEDEEAILNVTTVMLQRLGYTVLATPNLAKAVDIGKSHAKNIDLLITDVIMPGMNGKDLVKRIGQLFPDIKALFMSGYTSDVIAHHGVLDKGVYFIQKPFSRQELSKKVREVLDDGKSKS
ncbi:MAG: response regulator [Desulfobacteraceae bacterium]|nr:response regulator [Desulfobacteraceae bacterium]